MQETIADLIRGLGIVLLWGVTFGRYRSREDGYLLEGTVGLGAVALVAWAIYRWP